VERGPPREVIIKISVPPEHDADALLDELLDDDDHSTVSSLGHVEEKPKHDISKVISDGEDSDKEEQESPGLAAARARYKVHSTPDKAPPKLSLIHFDEREAEDPTRGHLEEISLGVDAELSKQKPKVIDVEKMKRSSRGGNRYPNKSTPTDDTSKTASGTDESPFSHMVRPRLGKQESDFTEEEDEDEEDDGSDQDTAGTKDLLARVQDRLTIQKLHDKISKLEDVVQTKNSELELLAGQLRRAVETKCDLVLAHTELERHHEHNLKKKEEETSHLLKANFGLMEGLADVEKDLLNEIVRLQVEVSESKKQHVQELQDWERMHKNEMLERDCEIARLREEVRKLLLKTAASGPGTMPGELIAC